MRQRRYADRIAVLGGGLQGCCVALALAERGARVTIFERDAALLGRTMLASEGKIHLGYVYAGDRSFATARTMMRGALAFAPLIQRFLGGSSDGLTLSSRFAYAVHRDSQRPAAEVGAYLRTVHAELQQVAAACGGSYFGIDLGEPPHARSAAARDSEFDGRTVNTVFDTPEIAVNPIALATAVRTRIMSDPAIELRTRFSVEAVVDADRGLSVLGTGAEQNSDRSYDHVVNALWDGRLAVDIRRGLAPQRPWLHRFKYGIRLHPGKQAAPLPSVTVVLGPFGDIVSYEDGSLYLSWYPVCMAGRSMEITPPDQPVRPPEPSRSHLVGESLEAMARIVPALGALGAADIERAEVRGGVITAWGKTDIDDPESELHRRHEIGVHSNGRYHSIDPGKLTMTPYFAVVCADRILGE